MMPKITVVTLCEGQPATLERTLHSVLLQDYPNLDHVVINGSPDLLSKYGSRLRLQNSLEGEGRFASLNRALTESTGEILTCLDPGSFYMPGALRAVGEMFTQLPRVEWLTSLKPGVTDAQGYCVDFARLPGVSREAFLDGLYLRQAGWPFLGNLHFASSFWRRSLWEKAGPFDVECRLAGDYDLWGRFFRHTHWLYACSSPLACGPLHSEAPAFEQEAHTSLKQLRAEVGWRSSSVRRLAFFLRLHSLPYLDFLPGGLYAGLHSLYCYQARTIVRRRFSSPDAYWAVSRLNYLRWPLSGWAPYLED